jgi:hypothetical protein
LNTSQVSKLVSRIWFVVRCGLWVLKTNQVFLFVGSATLCFLQAAGREGSCSRAAVSWKGTLIILDLNCHIFDSFYFSDYVCKHVVTFGDYSCCVCIQTIQKFAVTSHFRCFVLHPKSGSSAQLFVRQLASELQVGIQADGITQLVGDGDSHVHELLLCDQYCGSSNSS